MKYKISNEQYAEIKGAQKANRDKQIENRLKVLALWYEGKKLDEIAAATGFHHAHISNLIRKYFYLCGWKRWERKGVVKHQGTVIE